MSRETSLFLVCDFDHHISRTSISRLKQTLYICNVIIAAVVNCMEGIPSVRYCADKLCLSPNYLSYLLKKEKFLSVMKHIQQKKCWISPKSVCSSRRSLSAKSFTNCDSLICSISAAGSRYWRDVH